MATSSSSKRNEPSSSTAKTFTSSQPWARIRKRSATESLELAQQTSTQTSEYRLRMESVQWWRQQLEHSKSVAWKQLVMPTLKECHEFLEYQKEEEKERAENVSLENNANTSHGVCNDADDGDKGDSWWQRFCLPSGMSSTSLSNTQQQSQRIIQYPAEVLPIMVISSPLSSSCLVDRHAMATTLWKEWNNYNHNNNDLCLFLPRLLPTLTDTLYLLADGLATLLKQSRYSFLLQSRKKRKRTLQSSIQDWILQVMQSLPLGNAQDAPPNVVIVLEDDVTSSNVVKQQFLQTLMSWRSLQGVPVSLAILQSSPNNGPDGSLSTMLRNGKDGASGRFGRRVTYLTIPSAMESSALPDAMALWMQYFLGALQEVPPPLFKPRSFMEWMQESLSERLSCSRMADWLCGRIMESFSKPGSFVWDSLRQPSNADDCSSANVLQPSFCAWFCVYEKAQAMLSKSNDDVAVPSLLSADKCKSLLECRRYLQPGGGQLHFWWSTACALLPLQVLVLAQKQMTTGQFHFKKPFSLYCPTFMLSRLARAYQLVSNGVPMEDSAMANDDVRHVLTRYLEKNVLEDNVVEIHEKKRAVDQEIMGRLTKEIGELMLIVDNFQGESIVETSMDGKDIMKGISQMILDINHETAKQLDLWTRQWMHVNPLMKWMNLEDSSLQEKNDEQELLHNTINIRRDIVAGLDESTKRLLGVLQDQMTIAKDDWFRAFGGSMEKFCVGLWTLQMIGLVQLKTESRSGAGNVMYEKVSVVWC